MSRYRIFKYSHGFSTDKLTRNVEDRLQDLEDEGYEIISVAFGTNLLYVPTAFITVRQPHEDLL
jgi:hypothetical protein